MSAHSLSASQDWLSNRLFANVEPQVLAFSCKAGPQAWLRPFRSPLAGIHTGPGGQVSEWLAGDEVRDAVVDVDHGLDRVPAHREQEGVETVEGEFSSGRGVLFVDVRHLDVLALPVGETSRSSDVWS